MVAKVAILGASGYTGAELIRLIARHKGLQITALGAERKAGLMMGEVFPFLQPLTLPRLSRTEEIDFAALDLVFCALPHGTSQEVIAALPRGLKIVDLSADYRLRDPAAYAKWYGKPHIAPDVQREAIYGLTEFYRGAIAGARLVAGTGCNAAAGLYALLPLMTGGVIDLSDILIDVKAGVSGAGRALKENLLHAELAGGTQAYAAGGTHRHLGEFDQELSAAAGTPVAVRFTPHLLPMNRGILASVYVKGQAGAVHEALTARYAAERFLRVLPLGQLPSTRDVAGSNYAALGVVEDRLPGRTLIVSALDNLTKGSSGQALQNANLMLGFPEGMALEDIGLFP